MDLSHKDSRRTIAAPTIDPFYATDRACPDPVGLSLFTEPGDGTCWLYNPGDLELWLLHRIRHESFHACRNIYHPGRFRNISPVLYATRAWTLDRLPPECRVKVAACGHLDLVLNGITLLHLAASSRPELTEIDFRPHLILGVNQFKIRAHALGEPPAVLVQGTLMRTDRSWSVSTDDQKYGAPNLLAFTGTDRFPHQERLPEVALTPKPAGEATWDFGVEVYGRPVASVQGEGTLAFHPGESEAEARNANPLNHEQHVSALRPVASQVHSPVELALRFLRVESTPGLKVRDIKLSASAYPVRYRGAFASSDAMLDRIWTHAAYTLRLCMRELFVDGAKRDRLPWVGDVYLAGLANAYSFHDAGIIRRSLVALYGDEPESIDFNGIVDYSFFWILAVHDYVLHFGDMEFLEQVRPMMDRLLRALEDKRDAEDLIPTTACGWVFIDWAEVDKRGYSSCLEFLAIQASAAASRLLSFLGDQAAADRLAEKVEHRREAARLRFWSDADGAFRDCTGTGRIGRHANFLAVLAGVPTGSQCERLVARVLRNPAVPAVGTPYMHSLEAAALARCGLRAEMLQDIHEYWGGMIRAGASTFWERYDAGAGDGNLAMYGRPFGTSLCHAWSSGPIFLLSRELFGVSPLTPGWSRFTVRPQELGVSVSAHIPTPHGAIRLSQERESLEVEIPRGATLEHAGNTTSGPTRVVIARNTSRE